MCKLFFHIEIPSTQNNNNCSFYDENKWMLSLMSIKFRRASTSLELSAVSANLEKMDVVIILFLWFLAQKSHFMVNCLKRLFLHSHLTRLAPPFSRLISRSPQTSHTSSRCRKILKVLVTCATITLWLYLHKLLLYFVSLVNFVITLNFNLFGQILNIHSRQIVWMVYWLSF